MEHIKNLVPILILVVVVIYFIQLILSDKNRTQIHYDLPEEIMAADDTDTMNAVLVHDTIFITFKNKHR